MKTAHRLFILLLTCLLPNLQGESEDSTPLSYHKRSPELPSPPGAARRDLLEGLEGFPADALKERFDSSRKRFLIVNKWGDSSRKAAEPGTLRHCLAEAKESAEGEMTWIIFDPAIFPPDRDVKIDLSWPLEMESNTIIDGRGARVTICSTQGIHLLKIHDCRNVILKNLILHKTAPYSTEKVAKQLVFPVSERAGIDRNAAHLGINADAISIRGASDCVWVDHCTLFLCGDEAIGMAQILGTGEARATISWCSISDQYYAALVGQTADEYANDEKIRLTFHHNWIKRAARRSPRINRATADIYCNYLDGWMDWGMAANTSSRVLIEANILKAAPGLSSMGIRIGSKSKQKGFVRIRNNTLENGAELDSYMPEKVGTPTYSRSIQTADNGLREAVCRRSGWQDVQIRKRAE